MLTLLTASAMMAAETGGPNYPACPYGWEVGSTDGWEVGSTDGWEVGGKCVDPTGVIWTYDGKAWTTDGVIWSADGVIW
jgi:hypothetical protein